MHEKYKYFYFTIFILNHLQRYLILNKSNFLE
jgi:hypothetical protein